MTDTSAARDSADAGFVFGPRETGGVILGLRGAQLGALVFGLTAVVGGLSRGPIGAVTAAMRSPGSMWRPSAKVTGTSRSGGPRYMKTP